MSARIRKTPEGIPQIHPQRDSTAPTDRSSGAGGLDTRLLLGLPHDDECPADPRWFVAMKMEISKVALASADVASRVETALKPGGSLTYVADDIVYSVFDVPDGTEESRQLAHDKAHRSEAAVPGATLVGLTVQYQQPGTGRIDRSGPSPRLKWTPRAVDLE